MPFVNTAVLDGAKVLSSDNLVSLFNMETMELARKNKEIYFCMLPANARHLFQPLDVYVFTLMK